MLLQDPPNPFNWIIFTVVRWIISQINSDAKRVHKIRDTPHKLRAPTVIFRAIIQIQQQGFDLWKAVFVRAPKRLQTVHDEVTGDL